MIKQALLSTALVLGTAVAMTAVPASNVRADSAPVKCDMTYNLSGWSIIYKHASGTGSVTCTNGQHALVKITVVGGGLTAGKYHINNGKGEISNVHGIAEVFGDYAQAGADAGVVKSSQAQVLTKGNVSLALAGTGEGVNLGISAGKFTISRR